MMKKITLLVIAIAAVVQVMAQDVAGSYLGSLAIGGINLHLGINIKKISDTGYTATFDSPDQKAFGIPCTKTVRLKDSLFFEVLTIGVKYKGLWDGKDGISGTFKQGMNTLPLNLTRISETAHAAETKPPERPQTPKPPFNYVSEDVEYDSADKALHYGATFTRPNRSGKYPAVIIISGSGTQDRDGTLFGHKLYWVLADYLTKNGIAVLRVDDRGAGKSSLGKDFKNVTSVELSHDVENSLNYLETRADVDKRHLGLIGHSEGGIIAPMVASRRKDVSFIVLWGAPEVGGVKTIMDQNYTGLRNAGVDSVSAVAFVALHGKILNLFAKAPNADVLDQQITLIFESWKKQQTPQIQQSLAVQGNSIIGKNIDTIYNTMYNSPWIRFYVVYNPQKDLAKVKCSVLAVNGLKDTQVNAFANLSVIKQVLINSGNKDFEIKPIPDLNHLLQTAKTGDVSEYENITETMSPVAMKIISDWIKIHTK